MTEHFVTIFDSNFLPAGLCLHESLTRLAPSARLWVICMDAEVEQNLQRLGLENLVPIPLLAVEEAFPELLRVKSGRTRGEYCWTITSFAIATVLSRDASADRITYVDADLYFFSDPGILFREFEFSDKHVLITEHAYDPRYDNTRRKGRFCVQFMTFRRSLQAFEVMRWWQERCIEWCFARVERGKFGDQKYLDCWPQMFGNSVHVLTQTERTLAPWNADFFLERSQSPLTPVFYHFHGLRLLGSRRVLLFSGYQIGRRAMHLYQSYLRALGLNTAILESHGIPVPSLPLSTLPQDRLIRLKRRLFAGEGYAYLPVYENNRSA